MKTRLFIVTILLLCTLGAYFKFYKNLQLIPIGCDEFGYLNLAEAMSNNRTYTNHSQRPYLHKLLNELRKKGLNEREFTWMVTPHAYYVIPKSNQIINQYAPATSLLLSCIPLPIRKQLFSALAMFMILVFPLMALNISLKRQVNWTHLILLILVFSFTLTSPLLTELTRVNSVAPTIGLLLVAGYYLNTNTLISFFCIALTANFRLVNLLMLAPAATFIAFPSILTLNGFKTCIKKGIVHTIVVLVALLPYLIYVFKLRGNPLLPTYSTIDTNVTTDILSNVRFYCNIKDGWFQYNFIVVIILFVCVVYRKISLKKYAMLLLFPVCNYIFFLTHAIQINYYTYASPIILLGFLATISNNIAVKKNQQKNLYIACLSIAAIMLLDGVYSYKNTPHTTFKEAQKKYTPLCNYQVVWGDLLPSASEYVCHNNAFKFAAGSIIARATTVDFLYKNGYSQVFLLSDIPLPTKQILSELNSYQLPFKIDTLDNFGICIYLLPLQKK